MALPHAITASSCLAAQSRRMIARPVLLGSATAATAAAAAAATQKMKKKSSSSALSSYGHGGHGGGIYNGMTVHMEPSGRRFSSSVSKAAGVMAARTTAAVPCRCSSWSRLAHPADRVPRRRLATGAPDANRAQPANDHQGPSPSSTPSPSSSPSDASIAGKQDTQQLRSLPLPSEKEDAPTPTTTLEVGGEGVRLDAMGPLVVNRDGTTGRVANWAEMTEDERATTLALLGRRNRQRLEALRGQGTEGGREEK